MRIATFSSIWGSSTGGIDVFNMNLVRALSTLDGPMQVWACLQASSDAVEKDSQRYRFNYITPSTTERDNKSSEIGQWTRIQFKAVWLSMLLKHKFEPEFVILHDVFCKEVLSEIREWAPNVKVVTFFHNAYGRSDKRKDRPDSEIDIKIQYQREMIEESDIAISVGSFSKEYLCSISPPECHSKIFSLPPGRPDFKTSASKTNLFNAISFGRLDPISDTLKQIRLSAEAWTQAFRSKRISGLKTSDITFYAVGARGKESVLSEQKKKLDASWRAHIQELPFEDISDFDSSELRNRMSTCAFALLNSWYENFGLTYLEACTFGTPAIVSESSGFYHELTDLIGRDSVNELANVVRVEDATEDEIIAELKLKLIDLAQKYDDTFQRAQKLRRKILEHWPTWKAVSEEFLALLNTKMSPQKLTAGTSLPTTLPAERWPETVGALMEWSWEGNHHYYQQLKSFRDHSALTKLPLTVLQKTFWDNRQRLVSHPFRDLVLSGGTSSGKTTLAECLFGISRPHEFQRARILYIAPTKALAQERAEDWKKTFPSPNPRNPEFEPVLVSTGDDNAADGALVRGDFNIASTVYEKANVILSAGQDLLSQLNLVVIDEFHMLEDLHRGAVIECLLAKIKMEKLRRIDSVNKDNTLRSIIITTESPGESIQEFLSFQDHEIGELISPMILTDSGRAKCISHAVIAPGRIDDGGPPIFQIETFGEEDSLELELPVIRDISRNFDVFRSKILNIPNGLGYDDRRQRAQYQKEFCRSWLTSNPVGQRLLVFMSSKFDIIEFARMLKNDLRSKPVFILDENPRQAAINEDGVKSILEAFDEVENTDFVQDIGRCVEQGVFLHNADVPRKVRSAFEKYFATAIPAQSRSEIIIATETLSYGVNLRISDVALLNIMFPENERIPTGKPDAILLTRCDFVNMVGRAGRLGQDCGGRVANVYWYLDPEQESSFESALRRFYTASKGVRSNLLYPSDARSLSNLKKLRDQAKLLAEEASRERPGCRGNDTVMSYAAVERLSYPFTRSVLDSVRFLGGTAGAVGFLNKAGCSTEEVITEFFFETLYSKQVSGLSRQDGTEEEVAPDKIVGAATQTDVNDRKRRELIQAVWQVMESASSPRYELIKVLSSGSYQITALGAASIDTGTEIKTVVNLRRAVLALDLEWKSVFDRDLPFELAVLPAFFQPEVNRQYIARLPEFRLAIDWSAPENRDDLVSRVSRALIGEKILGVSDEHKLKAILSNYVSWTITNQPIVSEPGRYEEAAYDACLRLYVGFLAWIRGLSLRSVIGEIQEIYPSSGQKTESSVFNFEAFTENLTWKIMFLVSLLRASNEKILQAISTFDAVRFGHRARFGCVEQAIPLLFRNKSTLPPLNRVQAHNLILKGFSSASIALGKLDGASELGARKERDVRNHVRRYITESFQELSRQFCYLASAYGKAKVNEDISKAYWSFATTQVAALLDTASSVQIDWGISAKSEEGERSSLLDQEAQAPQVLLDYNADGLVIETYVPRFEGDDSDKIRLRRRAKICAYFSFGAHRGIPVVDGEEATGKIIVDFPWTMGINEQYDECLRMSPAAFGIMISLCSREFVADVDRYLGVVLKHGTGRCIGSRELYSITEPHLKKGGFPEGLFDAWAKYIEVGEF